MILHPDIETTKELARGVLQRGIKNDPNSDLQSLLEIAFYVNVTDKNGIGDSLGHFEENFWSMVTELDKYGNGTRFISFYQEEDNVCVIEEFEDKRHIVGVYSSSECLMDLFNKIYVCYIITSFRILLRKLL